MVRRVRRHKFANLKKKRTPAESEAAEDHRQAQREEGRAAEEAQVASQEHDHNYEQDEGWKYDEEFDDGMTVSMVFVTFPSTVLT